MTNSVRAKRSGLTQAPAERQVGLERALDQRSLKQHEVIFRGFDGNNEPELLSFTYALRRNARFESVIRADSNSHIPKAGTYHRMLSVWEQKNRPLSMDAATIREVLGS